MEISRQRDIRRVSYCGDVSMGPVSTIPHSTMSQFNETIIVMEGGNEYSYWCSYLSTEKLRSIHVKAMNATHLQSTIIITFNSQNNTGKLKSNVFFFFVAYYIFYISVRRRYYVQQLLTTITLLFNAAMTDRPKNLGIQSNAGYSTWRTDCLFFEGHLNRLNTLVESNDAHIKRIIFD